MLFDTFPDHSRLWLLALEQVPSSEALAQWQRGVEQILEVWRHKGQAYQGACGLLHGQILAVAEPTLAANPSGCAIDGMLRKLGRLTEELGLSVIDPAQAVLVRVGDQLLAIPKPTLAERIQDGSLDASTPVIDLSLYSLSDLRAGKLEAPLGSTWIGRKYLPISV